MLGSEELRAPGVGPLVPIPTDRSHQLHWDSVKGKVLREPVSSVAFLPVLGDVSGRLTSSAPTLAAR